MVGTNRELGSRAQFTSAAETHPPPATLSCVRTGASLAEIERAVNTAACSTGESSRNSVVNQAQVAGIRFPSDSGGEASQFSCEYQQTRAAQTEPWADERKAGARLRASKLLDDFSLGIADFDFAEVEFFHFAFDFGAVAYGYHGDLVRMNVFLRRGLGLLGIHGVHGIGKF